jgi:hypothetical protein
LYELRVFRSGREVRDSAYVTVLDTADVLGTRDLLDRHVEGCAARAGARRLEVHEFLLEVRNVDHGGKGFGDPLFRWALPMDPEARR